MISSERFPALPHIHSAGSLRPQKPFMSGKTKNINMHLLDINGEKPLRLGGIRDQQYPVPARQSAHLKGVGEGHFAPGSMLPKIQAGITFAESAKNRTALITLLQKAKDGVNGQTGTRIVQK